MAKMGGMRPIAYRLAALLPLAAVFALAAACAGEPADPIPPPASDEDAVSAIPAPAPTPEPPPLPDLPAGRVPGIDVSHHQAGVDWPAVAGSGVHFVYVKATEGIDYEDPSFDAAWQALGEAGLLRGAYHMYRPEDSPAEQAAWFLSVLREAGSGPRDLPPALDVERVSSTDSVPREELAAGAVAWLRQVEAELGRTPLLYTNPSFWVEKLEEDHELTEFPLWLAEYTDEEPGPLELGWEEWTLWQHSQSGEEPGIPKAVDLNVAASREALLGLLEGKAGGPGGRASG